MKIHAPYIYLPRGQYAPKYPVNPTECLTAVFTRIPEYNNNYDLDLAELLPHNWHTCLPVGRESKKVK